MKKIDAPATDQAAEVERNLEAQRQTIEACARTVEGSWVISGHVKERVAASVRALRPNQALATQTATGRTMGGECNCAARYYGDDRNAHQLCCAALQNGGER